MSKLVRNIVQLAKDDRGAPATEYALLIAGIALVAVVGMFALGGGLNTIFNNMGAALATTPVPPTLPGGGAAT